METHKLKPKMDKHFLKYCSKCQIFHPNALKKCPLCKRALKSFFLEYYKIKSLLSPLLVLVIFALCIYGTYGIQVNERAQYRKGLGLIKNKEFKAGWAETKLALAKNPFYESAKLLFNDIQGKSRDLRKEYIFQDLFYDLNTRHSILINSKVIFEGGKIDDLRVIKINRDSADIEVRGRQVNIRFGRRAYL